MFIRAAHIREAVLDAQIDARIVEASTMDVGQMPTRNVDDRRVDLGERHALDRRMLQQFFGAAAVAAADHQRTLRTRM